MIGAYGIQLNCKLCPARAVKLVGMDFGTETMPQGGREHGARLLGRKHSRLTKPVAETRQSPAFNGGQHLSYDEFHIAVPIVTVLRRHLVSAEERRNEMGATPLKSTDHLQLL